MERNSFPTRLMIGHQSTRQHFTKSSLGIGGSIVYPAGGGGAQDSPVSTATLPALPAGKSWSEERYIWVRVSNTQASAQTFYLGDAAGTNGISNGTVTWGGDFTTNTNSVVQKMTAGNNFFLTRVQMQADSEATLNAIGLQYKVAEQNVSGAYFKFPNTIIPKRTDNNMTIANWVMVNKWLRSEAVLTGSLPAGSVTTAVLDITLGYRKMLP